MRDNDRRDAPRTKDNNPIAGRSHSPDGAVQGCGLSRQAGSGGPRPQSSRGSICRAIPICSSESRPATTPECSVCPTISRSSTPSIFSRRWSTIRSPTDKSPPPTRCRTSMRWADVPRTALNIVCWPQSGLPGEMLARNSARRRRQGARGRRRDRRRSHRRRRGSEIRHGDDRRDRSAPNRAQRRRAASATRWCSAKPLGTGILMTAFKRDALGAEHYQAAVRSMAQLNARAAAAMLQVRGPRRHRHHGLRARRSRAQDGRGQRRHDGLRRI